MILTTTVFDFNKNSELNQWYLINDTVMGGRSNSSFKINKEGHVSFSGYVTTANNGGFASVRYDCDIDDVKTASHVLLRVKGDGKKYQLRFKKERSDYYSHIYNFKTSGEWETISIPMEEMYASYRGRTLDVPNFKADQIREISILIGNKKNEEFELLIDKIEMR
jgi:hypothetical protein